MAGLLLFILLITPVRLTLTLDGPLTVEVELWGLGRCWQPNLTPGGDGLGRTQLLRIAGAFFRSNRARRFLRRHVRIIRLQALVRLGVADAAHTAVFTGLLRQCAYFLPPHADVRIQPDFLSPTRLQARCILFFHLGTIILTAGMVLLAWLMECREHPAAKEA